MAETNDNISRLGLDIGPYIDALQEAVKGYQQFAKVISKTLSIRIDPSSINQISQALGVQIRQAVTLIDGANKEAIADSVKAAKEISAQYGKIAGTGEAAFKRVQAEAKKTAEQMAAEAMRIGQAGKQAGEAYADGITAGAKKAADQVKQNAASAAAASTAAAQTQAEWAKGQYDKYVQAQRRLEKEMGKSAASLGGRRSLDTLRQRLDPGVLDMSPGSLGRIHEESKQRVVDTLGMQSRIEAIRAKTRELAAELAKAGVLTDALIRSQNHIYPQARPGDRIPAGLQDQVNRYGSTFGRDALFPPQPASATTGEARLMAAIERAMTTPLSKARAEALADTARLMRNGQLVATATRVWNGDAGRNIYPQQAPFGGPGDWDIGRRRQNYNYPQQLPLGGPGDYYVGGRRQNYIHPEQAQQFRPTHPGDRFIGGRQQSYFNPRPDPNFVPPTRPLFGNGGTPRDEGGVAAATQRLGIENKIGDSLLRNATFLAKYIVLYRVIHDTARLVQNAIEGFFSAGVEYSKELETQTLALRGILAENYKVTLVQDQQVEGLGAVTALQSTALVQWKQIQQASLAVVGTTADLMQLYTGILPFASKLGADLNTVQKLTKDSAVAARLLDVSFSDARSGMVALLQGRALTRNRLVGALGFTKEQIADLKGTPQLIEAIQARLSDFAELAGEAQMTIAAMAESFKDFSGVLASGFTKPFTDAFKGMVGGLTEEGGPFALFSKTAGGLQIKEEVQSFINFTTAAIGQALGPLKAFGEALSQNIGNNARDWVVAMRDGAEAVSILAVTITKATLSAASWVANNRQLISDLGKLAIIGGIVASASRLASALNGVVAGSRALQAVLNAMHIERFGIQTNVVANAANSARSAVASLAMNGLGMLAKGALLGAVLYGLERIITAFERMRQRAASAKAQIKDLAEGNIGGFVVGANDTLKPDATPEEKAKTIARAAQAVSSQAVQLNDIAGSTPIEAIQKGGEYKDKLSGLSQIQQSVAGEITTLYAKIAKAEGARKEELQQQLLILQGEDAKVKGNIVDMRTAKERAQELSSNILTLQGLRPQIDNVLRDLPDDTNLNDMFPGFGFGMGSILGKTNRTSLGQRLRALIDEKMAEGVRARRNFGIFDETTLPGLEPIPGAPPAEDEEKHNPYSLTAPKRVEILRDQLAQEVGAVREAVVDMTMTRAEGDEKIQQLSEASSKRAIKIWEEQAEDFWETKKEGDGSFWDDKNIEAQQNMFSQIQEGAQAASQANEELVRNGRIAAKERAKAFAEAFATAEEDIARIEGEIGSRADDVALARYDKRIMAMRKQLTDNISGSPADRAKLRSFDERTAQFRPLVGRQAAAEDRIKDATAQLSVARESQSLLLQGLQNGTVTIQGFLNRTDELRERERQLLLDQISGTRQLMKVKEDSLKLSDLSPEQERSTKTAIVQLQGNIEQAQAALSMLDNQTEKVLAAAQAWENLTQKIGQFLSVADGLRGFNNGITDARLGLEKVVSLLAGGLGMINKITQGAMAFAQIPQSFKTFSAMFQRADGSGGLKSSFGALGSLMTFRRQAPVIQPGAPGQDSTVVSGGWGGTFMKALPAIGIGISAALAIGTAIFQRGVEKAKKDIKSNFEKIGKSFNEGNLALGQYIGDLEKQRAAMIRKYSKSKSGRSALKEMLPDIDGQIQQAKQQAKTAQDAFEDMFKRVKMGTGVFGDFARDLMDLEKTINDYLKSIDTSTAAGVRQYHDALVQVGEFRDIWFREAKQRLQENMLGFESEALGAAERFFSLLNEQEGLFRQLRDIDEQRADLDEQVADEAERRADYQKKHNELLEREAEIRKQIADVMKRAREEEADIRRRGILEAQLSVAQQKAIEIAGVRTKAQEEIDRLNKELSDLQEQARDDEEDEKKTEARRDRDFARARRNLAEREEEIRKATRLNDIRLAGAKAVADLEASVFGVVKDEFDLAVRQNDLQLRQAEIQIQRWKDTKALIDSIVDTANGVFFDPPDGFPQIHVVLGDITIDNRDQSTVNVSGGGGGGGGGEDDPDGPGDGGGGPGNRPEQPRPPRELPASFVDYERKFLRR